MSGELRAAGLKQGQITLKSLADRLNTLHEDAMQHCKSGLLLAKQIGELLAEAKEACKHGSFEAWVNHECDFSMESARRYMRVFHRWDELIEDEGPGRMSQMTFSEGIKKLTNHKKPEPQRQTGHGVTGITSSGGCFKGGSHVWEQDAELAGEYCQKCHERRPTVGPTADDDAEEYTELAEDATEASAAQGMAPGRLRELCAFITKNLPQLADAIAEMSKEEADPELDNILDALRVAYDDLNSWKKRKGL